VSAPNHHRTLTIVFGKGAYNRNGSGVVGVRFNATVLEYSS